MLRRIALSTGLTLLLALALFIIVPPLLPRPLRRRFMVIFYRDRKPTRLGRNGNLALAWVAARGLTPTTWPVEPKGGTVALEVRGRKTGQSRRNIVTWVEHDGERYFVSMLGDQADWVRNVRAAEGSAVIVHGSPRPVCLVELPQEQRPPVLREYLKLTANATRDHLGIEPDDPLEEFERIAPNHPVFHIVDPPTT